MYISIANHEISLDELEAVLHLAEELGISKWRAMLILEQFARMLG